MTDIAVCTAKPCGWHGGHDGPSLLGF